MGKGVPAIMSSLPIPALTMSCQSVGETGPTSANPYAQSARCKLGSSNSRPPDRILG